MKKFKKIIIIGFLWLFIVTIYSIAIVEAREVKLNPNVNIPGYGQEVTFDDGTTGNIAKYIVAIYKYGISVGAILATVVIMAAGLIWLTSGGSQEKIGQAKNYISGSIIGLVILFGSYILLNTINPELVNFNVSSIKPIGTLDHGCCESESSIMYQGSEMKISIAKMTMKHNCENDEVNGQWYENRAPNIKPVTNMMTGEVHNFSSGCVPRTGCCSITASGINVLAGISAFNWQFPSTKDACYNGGYNISVVNMPAMSLISNYRENELCEYHNVADCSNLENGSQCYNDKNTVTTCAREGACGFCYYGSCINTFGQTGDVCGKGSMATCKSSCGPGESEDNSARRCVGGLKCCKYQINI